MILAVLSIIQVVLLTIIQLLAIRFLGVTAVHEEYLLMQGIFLIFSTSIGTVSYNFWLPKFVQKTNYKTRNAIAGFSRYTTLLFYVIPTTIFSLVILLLLKQFTNMLISLDDIFLILVLILTVTTIFITATNLEVALLRASQNALYVEAINVLVTIIATIIILSIGSSLSVIEFAAILLFRSFTSYFLFLRKTFKTKFFNIEMKREVQNINKIFIPNMLVRMVQYADKLIVFSVGPGALIVWNLALQLIALGNSVFDKAINSRLTPHILRSANVESKETKLILIKVFLAYSAFGLTSYLIWFIFNVEVLLVVELIIKIDKALISLLGSAIPFIILFVLISNMGVQASALMINNTFYTAAGLANLLFCFAFLLIKFMISPFLSVDNLILLNTLQILLTSIYYFLYVKDKVRT